ncbi:hypothetical protein V6N11_058536 [Hibiscus sabdariffa]|uniref:DUF4283 domain-containing protein n=1 Tax=Hibiscus sabdariffa TaxID=183260 RepID=A0ABR2U4H8_9ROSI
MDLTLIVKVLGRRIGYNTLHNRIYGIWKPSHPLKLVDIENDFFFVKFSDRSYYLKVLTKGPWTIFGHYLTVEQWSVDFQPTKASPSRLMAWIRLLGLPLTLYKRSFLETIGNLISSIIKVDFQTDNGCRGRFARLAVSLNLRWPLVSKIIINGRTQIVVYESMSTVCFHYGIYGHLKDICPLLQRHDPAPLVQTETPLPEPRVTNSVPDENFGPWMLVERRTHNSRGLNPTNQASKESLQITPTLDPIFESIENLHDPLPNSWANVSKLVLATNDQSDSPEIAITDAPLVSTPSRQLFDKPKSAGKSTGNAQKVSSVHLVARKSTVTSIKVGCQSHGTSKTSLHGSRTPTHQHDVFSSSMPLVSLLSHSNSGPPTVILDPSRHQAIQLRDNDHPCIPIEAVTSDHYAHVMHKPASSDFYNFIIEKIRQRLEGWSACSLSLASCVTLEDSVLSAIPTYAKQVYRLPIHVCTTIERIIRQFIWGGSSNPHGVPLVRRDLLTQPCLHGGLGIHAIIDDTLLVKDVVLDSGDWNWPILQYLLQPEALPHIMNIPAPSGLSGGGSLHMVL